MGSLREVKAWSLLELVEAHLVLDFQERADAAQRRWDEKHRPAGRGAK